MSEARVARMNPDAVDEARVFTGRVHFYDGDHIEMTDVPFVEVGKWTAAGEERSPEDYDCTYYTALLLGHGLNMDWLPTGSDESGERKYLIFNGTDEHGRPNGFTMEEANAIAQNINELLAHARQFKMSESA